MQRILVPLDGSALSEAVMPVVLEMAQPLGASLVLLRVVVPSMDEGPMLGGGLGFQGWGPVGEWIGTLPSMEEERQKAEAYLQAVKEKIPPHIPVATEVRTGTLPDAILQAAREVGADLIAMSTHGRSGLGRLVLGSVTDLVVRLSRVPVLVVRPQPQAGA
jgi:nucleotide-binding universal stress UspA family protein